MSLDSDDPMSNLELGGRFRILSIVGEGGMGRVFLGLDTIADRDVAIKTLRDEFLRRKEVKQRFKDEARLLFNVSHSNIVEFLGFIEDPPGGRPFLIMEFVRGRTITEDVDDHGSMPPEKIVSISTQVLAGLHHLHTLPRPVIHRDVKPDNVVLVEGTTVKLVDFGIAKASGKVGLTVSGAAVGTYEFMAPEQVAGKSETLTAACDQYSLGITMFFMACRRVPFRQVSDSGFEVLKAHVEEPPPNPRRFNPDLPDFLCTAILRALSKDSGGRFESCQAMQEYLERNAG